MMDDHELEQSIKKLLHQSGCSTSIISIEKCEKGGNNRTYRVVTHKGKFAVKQYFRQPQDKRDRLSTEFSFLRYAKKVAPEMVPTPFHYDDELGLALYDFIEGTPFQINTITDREVSEAIAFFCALNEPNARNEAKDLPSASEACFEIQAHLDIIETRINELDKLKVETDEDKQAHYFIQQLRIYWDTFVYDLTKKNINLNASLEISQRCLSPSDFGFHNALRMKDGSIRFIDFEYAGWDDPAKMAGDFFSQLAIPVPKKYFNYFIQNVMKPFANQDELIYRAELLRYLYQIKWCCIALNIFLPVHLARRRFANPALDVTELKRNQLTKVGQLINNLGI